VEVEDICDVEAKGLAEGVVGHLRQSGGGTLSIVHLRTGPVRMSHP
jgi:hypothetical protein